MAINLIRIGLIKLKTIIHPVILESLINATLHRMNNYIENNKEFITLISTIFLTFFSEIHPKTKKYTTENII